jgi:hypothetical protein
MKKSIKMFLFLFLCLSRFCYASQNWKIYPLINDPIDVVIPCHPKDKEILKKAIRGVKKNVQNLGKIYVISPEKLSNEIWIDEKIFPFAYLFKERDPLIFNMISQQRMQFPPGWIFQQLLKLYVFEIIPEISSNVLLLDADTIFLKPISFTNNLGEPFYPTGSQYHQWYFNYGIKLLPGFHRVFPEHSGIANLMLVQRPVMDDLFQTIKKHHECEPWKAMLKCYLRDYMPPWVSEYTPEELDSVKISEYELYFNFLFDRSEQGHILKIKWDDLPYWDDVSLNEYAQQGYTFISAHSWMRKDRLKG